MMTVHDDEWLTPAEVAQRKHVTPSTVYKAITSGRLDHVRLLNRIALRPSDVARWTPEQHGGRRVGQGRPRRSADR